MINKQVFELTEEGKTKLEVELEKLKTVDRQANIEAIQEARAQGDLSENADYDAARDEQRRIEARILEIENILKNVKVITVEDSGDKITTGKTVKILLNYNSGKNNGIEKEYSIVGTIEADPFNNKISNDSPLGKTLIGHKAGDIVTVTSENGKEHKVKVLSII